MIDCRYSETKKHFKLFAYWYCLYKSITTKVMPKYSSIRTEAKIAFNGRVSAFKNWSKMDAREIADLMFFCLVKNPLGIDIEDYGDFTNISKSTVSYRRWCQKYEYEVNTMGLHKALYSVQEDIDMSQDDLAEYELMAQAFEV